MQKHYFVTLLITVVFVIIIVGCNDTNIVDPRFFSEGDVLDANDLPIWDGGDGSGGGNSRVPTEFSMNLYWEDNSQQRLLIAYSLPETGLVEIFVLGNAGNVIMTLISGSYPAGQHTTLWDLVDDKKQRIENNVHGVSIKANDFGRVVWFKIG